MKKSSIVWLTIAIVIVVIILLGGAYIFSKIFFNVKATLDEATTEKTAITAEQFKSDMEAKGYQIVDATYQTEDYSNQYYEKVYLAINESQTYQIEFFQLTEQTYAQNLYTNFMNKLEETKSNNGVHTVFNGINYDKYTVSDNGAFAIVSRIGNTVMYTISYDNYKNEINNIFEEYNY